MERETENLVLFTGVDLHSFFIFGVGKKGDDAGQFKAFPV